MEHFPPQGTAVKACTDSDSVIATYSPKMHVEVRVENKESGDCRVEIELGSSGAVGQTRDRGFAVVDKGDSGSVSAAKVGRVTISCHGDGGACKYTYSIHVG